MRPETHSKLIPGLVSVTFRDLSPEAIVLLAQETGLRGIEWGGDVHVPPGNLESAREVHRLTHEARLEVAAYGSYYRIGKSEREGLRFERVLSTAETLEAPRIRVWAGDRNSEDATREYRQMIADESRRIADLAASREIQVVYEFHDRTLTNTAESCRTLLETVNHPNLKTYWQPIPGARLERNCADLDLLSAWVCGVHVFHWWPTHAVRHPLKAGAEDWSLYLARLWNLDGYALLEFVKDDSIENFRIDAGTLQGLLTR